MKKRKEKYREHLKKNTVPAVLCAALAMSGTSVYARESGSLPQQDIMNGVDISRWQEGINLDAIDADFVICKASGGKDWLDWTFPVFAEKTLSQGRMLGFYHYARDRGSEGDPWEEAFHFYRTVSPYLGRGIPVLDFEGDALKLGPEWAEQFLDVFYQLSGVRCLLYTSAYFTRSMDWASVSAKGHPLWLAQYETSDITHGYLEDPWVDGLGTGAFDGWVMHQYSGNGRIPGYDFPIDLDKFYGTAEDWKALQQQDARLPSRAMYRLYNPNSGEHHYTSDRRERVKLVEYGWKDEGIGWIAPEYGQPVYRLYNPNGGDHHYTLDLHEKDALVKFGWKYEGIGWYSSMNQEQPVYRSYNPNADTGSHHFSPLEEEHRYLGQAGWNNEGVAWYALSAAPQTEDRRTHEAAYPDAAMAESDCAGTDADPVKPDQAAQAGYDDPAFQQ